MPSARARPVVTLWSLIPPQMGRPRSLGLATLPALCDCQAKAARIDVGRRIDRPGGPHPSPASDEPLLAWCPYRTSRRAVEAAALDAAHDRLAVTARLAVVTASELTTSSRSRIARRIEEVVSRMRQGSTASRRPSRPLGEADSGVPLPREREPLRARCPSGDVP